MRKKFLSMALAFCMVLGLAACAGSNEGSVNSESANETV